MSNGFGMLVECVVAILLVLTVGYCMMLNRRLKLLRADEETLRATISELVTATEIAERAIAGLKITARECDIGLGERLSRAERLCVELDRRLAGAKDAVSSPPPLPKAGGVTAKSGPDPQSIAAAAQAFAERLRTKVYGLAA